MKTHFSPIILLALLLSCANLNAQQPEDQETNIEARIETLFKELNSDDFRTREAAMVALWKIGDAAEPFIREAAKSGDIESRTRAAKLLMLYTFGIYPDTPKEVITNINQFRHGDLKDRATVLQKLYESGEIATVTKLIQSVKDSQDREDLVRSVVAGLEEQLSELFAENKLDEVEPLLKLAAISDEGLRDLSGFYAASGTLDEKIDALLKLQKQGDLKPLQYEQLSWHYRFKGDLAKALTAAESAGNENLTTSVRIAQGDLLALIRSSYNPNDRTIQSYGFTAAAQRLSGDQDGFKETINTIKQYAADRPDELDDCLEALVINGELDAALEISKKGSPERLTFLIDRGKHLEALKELGIGADLSLEKWLQQAEKDFAGVTNNPDYNRVLPDELLIRLAGWNEKAKAAEILDRLANVAVEKIDLRISPVHPPQTHLRRQPIRPQRSRSEIHQDRPRERSRRRCPGSRSKPRPSRRTARPQPHRSRRRRRELDRSPLLRSRCRRHVLVEPDP